jgi:N-glycosylase/DNA lyase
MQSVEELSRYYNKVRAELKKRLSDFKNVNGDAIFYECCFCILTPQSNAKQCWAAVERLIQNSFIDKNINPEPLVYPIRF